MLSTTRPAADLPALAGEVAGTYATGPRSPLAELESLASAYHDLVERILRAWLRAVDWGGIPAATGLPGDAWLTLVAKLPPALAAQVRSVADRLCVLPRMRDAYESESVTFDQLATFVRLTRECNGEVLVRLDEEIASRAHAYALDGMDPDQLGWDTEAVVADLRAPGWANRAERRREHGSELRLQGDLDGGVALSGSFTPEDAAPVVTWLEATAGRPDPTLTRAQQRAEAMVATAEHVLGADCDAAPSRPTMTLLVDLTTATPDRFASILTATTAKRAPTLSARACDTIAESAELRVLLAKGRNPLAELKAKDIPAPVRRTVGLLHGECSMPGCHRPVWQCDLNHLTPRKDGGGHEPINLGPICRGDHGIFHANDAWSATKHPRTGQITYLHEPTGTRVSSLPKDARPIPWSRDDWRLAAGLAPPIHPPPDHPPDAPPDG